MLAAGSNYAYTCKPEDVFAARQADRENYFFIDVQSRGEYPAYALKKWPVKVFKLKWKKATKNFKRTYGGLHFVLLLFFSCHINRSRN